MFKQRSRRGGFTLPEVLVTVAIVAILAAAVVPTVVNQITKGEGASFSSDANALTHAVTQFITDTRQYPSEIDHLINPIVALDKDILTSDYTARAIAQWKGPYLATSQNVLTNDYTFTGYGLIADNVLVAPSGQGGFITLNLDETGITLARLGEIDAAVDGGDGVVRSDCATGTASTGSTSGRLQWTEAQVAACTITNLVYRLVPTGG